MINKASNEYRDLNTYMNMAIQNAMIKVLLNVLSLGDPEFSKNLPKLVDIAKISLDNAFYSNDKLSESTKEMYEEIRKEISKDWDSFARSLLDTHKRETIK